jgi:DNA-binding MarR family transcriptional regulator
MAEVKWLDEREQRAWRLLVSTSHRLHAVLDIELRQAHQLALADYEVLVMLSEAPDQRLRMAELARALYLTPSGLTRRIDGLVAEGLVDRERCDTDRRGFNAVLTTAGRKVLDAAAPTHVEGVRRHFIELLSDRQLTHLSKALEAASTDPSCADPPPCPEA